MAGMLEGLDSIDWARLGHAYGTADDVPGQLRALASDDADLRGKALYDLYGNIFHQGTRYEATAYAVPFLLELLGNPAAPNRADILGLLTSIAIGFDEQWLPFPLPIAAHREESAGGAELVAQSHDYAPDDLEEDEEVEEYAFLEELSDEDQNRYFAYIAVAAYDAGKVGVPFLRTLLSDPDLAVATRAAYALAWFPEEAADSIPVLSAATASDPVLSATSLAALGLLGSDISEAFLTDAQPLTRWGAAIALAQTHRDTTPPLAVTELLHWTASPAASDERIPFLNGDLSGYAAMAAVQTGPANADAAFAAMLTRFGSMSGTASLPVTAAALQLAFPNGAIAPGTPFSALDSRQQQFTSRLAECPNAWLYNGSTFGNFSLMMSAYSLPNSHEAMQSFTTT